MSNVTGPLPGATPTPQAGGPRPANAGTGGSPPVVRGTPLRTQGDRTTVAAADPAVATPGPDEGSINIPNLANASGKVLRPTATTLARVSQAITQASGTIAAGNDGVAGVADVAVNLADSQEAVTKALANTSIPPNVASRLDGIRGKAIAAGRVVGAAGAVMALSDLAKAATASPLDLAGVGSAIANLAMNMDAVTTELVAGPMGKFLEKVGGAGAIVGGLLGLVDKIQNWKENGGANAQNILGVIGDAAQIAAGVCMFIPGAQIAVAPLFLLSAGANLTAMAVEHWDDIKSAASQATNWVGNTATAAANAVGSGLRNAGAAVSQGVATAAKSVMGWLGF